MVLHLGGAIEQIEFFFSEFKWGSCMPNLVQFEQWEGRKMQGYAKNANRSLFWWGIIRKRLA